MRVIVTGGAGFIGSHLVELLISQGHEAIVLDDQSTGKLHNLPTEAHYHYADIRNYNLLDRVFERLIKFGPVDCMFHLAARASIVPSIKDPHLYHDVNMNGTFNVLEMARRYEVKKLVYAASGSCYGIPEQIPTTETCKIDPQYPYALTKYTAEQYIMHWSKVYGMPFVSLRLFNVFGPRMCLSGGYGGLFSTILAQKLNNQPVITMGNGEQTRDFIYVTDVARAFLSTAESDVKNEIFNIGTGQSWSVNQILDMLDISYTQVRRLPDRPGEPRDTCANISKIVKMLNWRPEVSFSDGLALMTENISYWKNGKVWSWAESMESQEDWYKYLGHKK